MPDWLQCANARAVVSLDVARWCQRITPLEGFGYGDRPYFSTILCYRGEEAWG